MEFVGPITPGSSDVTLYGTAEEIYGQIMQLNPSYNVWDFPEYSESLTADGFTTADLDITNMSANPQTVSRNNLLEFAKVCFSFPFPSGFLSFTLLLYDMPETPKRNES